MRSVRSVNFINVVLLCLITLTCGGRIHAQAKPASASGVALIPMPKEIVSHGGTFQFTPNTVLVLGQPKDAEDTFAASGVAEELKSAMGVTLTGKASPRSNRVVLARIGRDPLAAKYLPALTPEQRERLMADGSEGYIVHVTPGSVLVAAKTGAGLYYGVQTLKQLIRANATGNAVPCVTITDWPSLRYRGVMLDISRGPIMTMGYLKEIVASLASYKQNALTLYTEHVFRLRSHPDVAPADGITPAQVAELSAFARLHHIDLIGNAQPFGHMEHTLEIPFYRPMGENAWVVSPAVEKTYDYLKDVFAEVVPSYESKLFHINSDEVSGLGEGPARRMVDSLGVGGVYAYHINRVNSLIKPYGKRLMMWGDIAVNNPQIIDRLPKDLIVVSWGYHVAESFDDAILPFKKTGFDFMVAPGVSCWGNVWPNMSVATLNISNYVRDGAALGTMGMMNTVWVDDGENLGAYNWHGLVWGAECSWSPARRLEGAAAKEDLSRRSAAYDRAFDALFFGTTDVASTLYQFDTLRARPVRGIVTDGAVWSSMFEIYPGEVDARAGVVNDQIVRDAEALRSRLSSLRARSRWHQEVLDAAIFAADRVRFTARKNLVRAEITSTMRAPLAANVARTRGDLQTLFAELHALKTTYALLWDRENRGWWRDRVLAKYDRLGAQILDLDKVVLIEKDSSATDGGVRIRCSTPFADQEIRYTVDGSEPSMRSPVYAGPVILNHPALVRARIISGKQQWPVTEQFFLVHRAIGKIVAVNTKYSTYDPAYAAGGPMGLADGLRGSENFKDGRWQAYQGQDINVVLDLGTPAEIHRLSMGCLQSGYSWILMPSRVQYWTSLDGREYTLAKELTSGVDPKAEGTVIHDFTADLSGVRARFIKVIAQNPGPLPAWHQAAGSESFMFADEIIVE